MGAKQIVILGAGFGGLCTARHLAQRLRASDNVRVTLISRENYFVITPLLFEAGSGVLEPRHAVNPIRTLFDGDSFVNFVEAEIAKIDLDAKQITFAIEGGGPQQIHFDQLVVALGGMTNTAILPGAAEHALTFKTLGDAMFLRNHTIRQCERADAEQDASRKRRALTFVVIGAGFVGVELIGELTEFLHNVVRRYHHIQREEVHFELIEAGPRVSPELDDEFAQYIVKTLSERGVKIRTNTPVERVEPGKVVLKGGETIESETILAVTGVTPSRLVKELPVEKNKRGAILVDSAMRVKDRPGVWALGDCASIPVPGQDGKTYPPLAQMALREAKTLAKNIVSLLRDGEKAKAEPFVYETKGLLASLGHYDAVANIKGFHLYGFLAWWFRRSYYLFQMPQWSRRLRIVIDWTVALFFRNDVVQLDPIREVEWREAHDEENRAEAHK